MTRIHTDSYITRPEPITTNTYILEHHKHHKSGSDVAGISSRQILETETSISRLLVNAFLLKKDGLYFKYQLHIVIQTNGNHVHWRIYAPLDWEPNDKFGIFGSRESTASKRKQMATNRTFVPRNHNYRKISNIRRTKSPNLIVSRLALQLSLPNPMKSGVPVDNEDVVGATPTGDAPTTSEWSTILLPTKMCLILETWRYTTRIIW